MPTVSIYIKNEDWEAWRGLEKPSEFIHNALNNGAAALHLAQASVMEDRAINKFAKTPSTAKEYTAEVARTFDKLGVCKHGSDPKFCKYAKPGKSCK